ncbi:hypothetical protein [aff. Roholtiella sp. LEGE 12411]|uniref:hypothetical protein n=1 Tax=aff. Roholtiella sp. LEGE 12411 TaxID=1828822 RepID=UPI001882030C|nr:hypothetical protein [aff. Roholtiella sp. LEGE 12411]MBE9036034.1 hypothetical protein [aff. Roholtiella sp. LEGE 12411]
MAIESRLTIRIEEEIRTAFRSKVEAQGKTVTDVLLNFIKEYVETENSENNHDVAQIEQRVQRLESLVEECLGELVA